MRTRQSVEVGPMASDPPRGTRRKRRSSAGPESSSFSQDVEPSNDATSSQVSRRKRTKRTSMTSSQQLDTELEQSMNHEDEPAPNQETVETNETAETIEVMPHGHHDKPKHVHFSDSGLSVRIEKPPTPPDTVSPETPNANPTTRLTPHVQRASMSPNPQSGSQRRRASRGSLPPTLRGSPDGTLVAELQFSPLREILDERVQRRLRRSHLSEEVNAIEEHKKEDVKTRQELEQLKQQVQEKNKRMRDLEWELENQRQMGIDVSQTTEEEQRKNREIQEELDVLRQEVAAFKETGSIVMSDDENQDPGVYQSFDAPVAEDADNDVTLVDPTDINVSHTSLLPAPSSFEKEPTPVQIPDPTLEAEVYRFEQVTTSLNHELAAARAALQILTTELQALGFSELDAGTEIILANIRAAFRDARSQINEMIPQAEGNKFENAQFLKLLVENIRNLLAQVGEQTQTIHRSKEMEVVLKQQHSGLLDKLAETEQRKRILQSQWNKMDLLADARGKKIVELEDELGEWKGGCDERDKMITDGEEKIAGLEEDIEMRDQDNEKLQHAINSYRKDLEKTEVLLHNLEEQYKQHVASMEKTHTDAVRDLEGRLDDVNDAKAMAEKDAEAKAARIALLEDEIERANADIDLLKTQLAESQKDLATQSSQRELAELEIDEKTAFITGLELKLESSEENLDALRAQLEQLRELADSERRQRKAVEAELDDRNADVEILDNRLKQAGKDANELRSKLFEAQQRREREVANLTAAAAERESELQAELDEERSAKTAAEQHIEELNDVIADLEEKLRDVEDTMANLLAEKDELLSDRAGRIDELESLLKEQDDRHRQFAEDKGKEIQALRDDVAALDAELHNRGKMIEDLEADAAENSTKAQEAIAAKDEAIEELNDDLNIKKQELAALEKVKQSLERRIEDEVAAMVQAEAAHNNAISELNTSLNARDKEIGKLLMERQAAESRYSDLLQRKNEKIESLQRLAETRLGEVNGLNGEVEDLKDKLSESVRKSREAIERINKRTAAALAASQDDESKLMEDTDKLMSDVEAQIPMVDGAADVDEANEFVPPKRSGRFMEKVMALSKSSVSKKTRRDRDSAIGLDRSSDEGEDTEAFTEEMIEA